MSIIFHNYINNRHKHKYVPVSRYKIIFPYTELYKWVIGFDMCHNSFLFYSFPECFLMSSAMLHNRNANAMAVIIIIVVMSYIKD